MEGLTYPIAQFCSCSVSWYTFHIYMYIFIYLKELYVLRVGLPNRGSTLMKYIIVKYWYVHAQISSSNTQEVFFDYDMYISYTIICDRVCKKGPFAIVNPPY